MSTLRTMKKLVLGETWILLASVNRSARKH